MKERKSFRFSLDTFQKLDTLQELEKQQAEKFNITPKSITAIVEDAIAEYYVLKLDKDTGTDYLTRMNLMIQDALKQQNHQRDVYKRQVILTETGYQDPC